MKAVRIHEFGGPEVLKLEEIAIPECGDDQVLIKVYASSINPMDRMIFSGMFKDYGIPAGFPFTMGWDISGVVEKVGANVNDFKAGDEVYGRPNGAEGGSFAEYAVVIADDISIKPESIDHINAAAVPLTAQTAWQALFKYGKLEKGQKVLIHGASGGVGGFAVQFAKWKGAHVIGTASTDNIDYIKELGADEVVDYKIEQFEDKIKDVDLVLDLIGKETQKRSLLVVKEGGRIITTMNPDYKEEAAKKNIQLDNFSAETHTADLKQIALLIDGGSLIPQVGSVISLEDVIAAETNKNGGRGKIVVKIV